MNIYAHLTGVDLGDRSISVEIRQSNLKLGKQTTIDGLRLAQDAKITEGGNAIRLEDLTTELAKERVDLFITLAATDGGIVAITIQRTEKVVGGPQIKR